MVLSVYSVEHFGADVGQGVSQGHANACVLGLLDAIFLRRFRVGTAGLGFAILLAKFVDGLTHQSGDRRVVVRGRNLLEGFHLLVSEKCDNAMRGFLLFRHRLHLTRTGVARQPLARPWYNDLTGRTAKHLVAFVK